MNIEIVCDRCFEPIIKGNKCICCKPTTVFKYGSCIYCEKCHSKIENELHKEMITEAYIRTTKDNEQSSLIRRLA